MAEVDENPAQEGSPKPEPKTTKRAYGDGKEGPYRTSSKGAKRPSSPLPRKGGIAAKAARFVFWLIWFVSVPFTFAYFVLWAFSAPSGVDHGGVLGWLESIVREQPVPVGIVAFTIAEAAIWNIRRKLPLARFAYGAVPADLPRESREAYERALLLLEEADNIQRNNARAVARDLSAKEHERLHGDLDKLAGEMTAHPFDKDAFMDALALADKEVDSKLGRWRKSEAREYVESILLAVAVALLLRTFVVEAFKIPSGSMIPTLQVGDHIFVNKFSYGPAIPFTRARMWKNMPPHRGDVMVFISPEHPDQDYIKRVIAIPGDVLEVRAGHPIINGWEVPNCSVGTYTYMEEGPLGSRRDGDLFVEFLEDEAYLTLYDRIGGSPDVQGPYTAKEGEVWVMGDNRNNSNDSRMWNSGMGAGVPFDNIKGRALFVWLSVADGGRFDLSRMGAPVMGRPRLPPAMKSLEPALEKCLRERPPLDKTRPPPPR